MPGICTSWYNFAVCNTNLGVVEQVKALSPQRFKSSLLSFGS